MSKATTLSHSWVLHLTPSPCEWPYLQLRTPQLERPGTLNSNTETYNFGHYYHGYILQVHLLKNNRSGNQLRYQALILLLNQEISPSLLLKWAGSHTLSHLVCPSGKSKSFLCYLFEKLLSYLSCVLLIKIIWKKSINIWSASYTSLMISLKSIDKIQHIWMYLTRSSTLIVTETELLASESGPQGQSTFCCKFLKFTLLECYPCGSKSRIW